MEKIKLIGKRENGFIPETETNADMKWVVRDSNGKFFAMGKYRSDLRDEYENENCEIEFIGD